jgi:hypothetical protein
MAQQRFPVLVATDGSAQARAAVETALAFPWPRGNTGHGIVARGAPVLTEATPVLWETLLESGRAEARRAERRLRRGWPNAEVVLTDAPPVPAILKQARKLRVHSSAGIEDATALAGARRGRSRRAGRCTRPRS